MEINADVGEMTGADGDVMPFISIGNIACGGHASDREHMVETVRLALACGVKVSAHPGYADVENFGRVSVEMNRSELIVLVRSQVSLLKEVCDEEGAILNAIKPHGALYHDMMHDERVREVMINVASEFNVPLVVQAKRSDAVNLCCGSSFIREVFADRGYRVNGELMARSEAGALLTDPEMIVRQAKLVMTENMVICNDGSEISLAADTICFHGDNPASVMALKILSNED